MGILTEERSREIEERFKFCRAHPEEWRKELLTKLKCGPQERNRIWGEEQEYYRTHPGERLKNFASKREYYRTHPEEAREDYFLTHREP